MNPMKNGAFIISVLAAVFALAFFLGRMSINESQMERRITDKVVQDTILNFQKSAFSAGFLKHTPIAPGEAPRWVWKTREEIWHEVDQEKIAEFTKSEPQLPVPMKAPDNSKKGK